MKKTISLLSLMLCTSAVVAQPVTSKSSAAQQVGYSFGYLMGRNNADSIKDLDLDAFVQGLKEASKGQTASLTDEEMARVLTQYKKQSEAKLLIELKQKAEANERLGVAFLAENAKKPGVQVTASGLQYLVLQAGKGKSPKATSKVKVNYEGKIRGDAKN